MKHTCHAYGCKSACPPKWLMCRPCWNLVSPSTQAEVCRTVGMRAPRVDGTWRMWWRAQATAVAENGIKRGFDLSAWLTKQLAFADSLGAR